MELPKELTDGEIWEAISSNAVTTDKVWLKDARAVIAAHIRKQSEPERVKFRAARLKPLDDIQMLRLGDGMELGEDWEWLEPEQSFEVVLP